MNHEFKVVHGAGEMEGKTYASTIATIVSGLYRSVFDIVREYCQNGYDAILTKYKEQAAKHGRLELNIYDDKLSVFDNGTGMSKEVLEKAATIGYSTKDSKDQVGYRGIGRLAGVSAAEVLHILTKTAEGNEEYLFEIKAKELMNSLDRYTKFTQEAGHKLSEYSSLSCRTVASSELSQSYTNVILYRVYGEAGRILNHSLLLEYLQMNLPVSVDSRLPFAKDIDSIYRQYELMFPNIQIKLGKKNILKPYHEIGTKLDFDQLLLKNQRGKLMAIAWFLWDKEKSRMINIERLRGLRYRHRGFAIGTSDSMRAILDTSPPQLPDWFAGEIVVIDDRLKVSSDRSRFEDNTARSELEQSLKDKLAPLLDKISRTKSNRNSAKKRIDEAKKTIENLHIINKTTRHVSKEEIRSNKITAEKSLREMESLAKSNKISGIERNFCSKKAKELQSQLKKVERKEDESKELHKLLSKNAVAAKIYKAVRSALQSKWDEDLQLEELLSEIEHRIYRVLLK